MSDQKLAVLPEHEWRLAVLQKLSSLQAQVDANTDITADTQEVLNRDVGEIKDILNTVKGGLKFLGWMGASAKWIAGVLALFVTAVAAFKALK